jgi:hypothetical protein
VVVMDWNGFTYPVGLRFLQIFFFFSLSLLLFPHTVIHPWPIPVPKHPKQDGTGLHVTVRTGHRTLTGSLLGTMDGNDGGQPQKSQVRPERVPRSYRPYNLIYHDS